MTSVIRKVDILLIIGAVSLINVRCRQPYVLPVSAVNSNYLVVEGMINNSPVIKLSRTVRLSDTVSVKPETGASVSVESQSPGGSSGVTTILTDNGSGNYSLGAGSLALNQANLYRLRIVTSNGKNYISDFVPVKNSPPVDSISYEVKSNGIQIYSASHDPANNTRYYRWDYNETWIIQSKYPSTEVVVHTPKDTIITRPYEDFIFSCWQSDASTGIILNSSAKLTQDVIVHNPVTFISSSSEKLGHEYSILVNQYALTADAYNYWQNLKKNTEQLGSIFDAQPSEIKGNINSVNNPSEPVLGYISAGLPSQTRIFIGNSQVPYYWFKQIKLPYDNCILDSVYYKDPKFNNTNTVVRLYPGGLIPTSPIWVIPPNII
ncbi:MAG: DUF4249 domain-containing protein, partial [Mucilaginibacter sp.]